MELLHNLYTGFSVALLPVNLLFCFLVFFLGQWLEFCRASGRQQPLRFCLPMTFSLHPETAIIMLAGIFYGTQYGGSTTSILVNLPGEASSVVTCLDGYQMARQGRAGPALGISAFGSFIGGTLSVIGLMFLGPWVARFALRFGPPEYVALMCLSIVILTFLSRGSMTKSLTFGIARNFREPHRHRSDERGSALCLWKHYPLGWRGYRSGGDGSLWDSRGAFHS